MILHGRVWKTLRPREYYEHVPELLGHVLSAYEDLAGRFDVIVIEGAGSVSELNLRQVDLVNLGLATRIGAPWVLVADIERGGLIASVVGTVALLTPAERSLFRGFLVNKFRGDRSLFADGRRIVESHTGTPCLGIFPFADDLRLDAEDSLALDRHARSAPPEGASVAIVQLPRLSNGTDFKLLTWAEWISSPADRLYDFVILPGTKDTIGDLTWMRERALDAWVLDQHRRGATVIGICGGFQMLGEVIHDPGGMESLKGSIGGLGLLPVETVLTSEKTTRLRRGATAEGVSFAAYEIHVGVTTSVRPLPPFAWLEDGTVEGVRTDRVVGTYLHGAVEDPGVCAQLFGVQVNDAPPKTAEYAALVEWFERYAEDPGTWLA